MRGEVLSGTPSSCLSRGRAVEGFSASSIACDQNGFTEMSMEVVLNSKDNDRSGVEGQNEANRLGSHE